MVAAASTRYVDPPKVRSGTLMVALLAACTAFQLNASMLSPALVTMAREFNADEVSVGLTQTAFFTSTALFGLFLPRWSDIVGRRKVMLLMLVGMTLGAAAAAVAPNMETLLVARAAQGVSGSIIPVCLLMLRTAVTDRKKYGTLMGVVAAVNGGIAGVDALAGGFLATTFGFRSIFLVITIVGVLATVLVFGFAPDSRPSAGTKMDWRGVVPLVAAILFLQLAVNETGKLSNANWAQIGLFILAGLGFGFLFYKLQGRTAQPLASPAMLKRRATWAMVLTTVLTMTGIFATVNGVVMSLAQNASAGFGLHADTASLLILTPYALIGWIVGPLAGRLAPIIGYRTVLRIGLMGSVAGITVLALWGVHSLPVLVGATIFLGLTYAGMVNIMLNGLGIVLSPKENPGFLPGFNASGFGLGAGLSFAILPAVQLGAGASTLSGYSLAMLVGAGITLAAFLMSLLIPKPANAELEE
ncbi:MFS transporter [Arthrobacter sp. MYb23]|uniref:uridine transporter UriT n=1 Tax=unclassified Arthrobacter TaxID=235627 RepID=UPI000CFC2347|nr:MULTISPECIES: MFS transporter [unclassified Arthrobacter]PRB34170.1 MFS transporter [Arthrobacter sp. MYb51]PRB88626.1 MFS transporter [Arthrobacter sp. MYb23]